MPTILHPLPGRALDGWRVKSGSKACRPGVHHPTLTQHAGRPPNHSTPAPGHLPPWNAGWTPAFTWNLFPTSSTSFSGLPTRRKSHGNSLILFSTGSPTPGTRPAHRGSKEGLLAWLGPPPLSTQPCNRVPGSTHSCRQRSLHAVQMRHAHGTSDHGRSELCTWVTVETSSNKNHESQITESTSAAPQAGADWLMMK